MSRINGNFQTSFDFLLTTLASVFLISNTHASYELSKESPEVSYNYFVRSHGKNDTCQCKLNDSSQLTCQSTDNNIITYDWNDCDDGAENEDDDNEYSDYSDNHNDNDDGDGNNQNEPGECKLPLLSLQYKMVSTAPALLVILILFCRKCLCVLLAC